MAGKTRTLKRIGILWAISVHDEISIPGNEYHMKTKPVHLSRNKIVQKHQYKLMFFNVPFLVPVTQVSMIIT